MRKNVKSSLKSSIDNNIFKIILFTDTACRYNRFHNNFKCVMAIPVGPTITFNSSTNATPRSAVSITTAGGSFTTLVLNTTGTGHIGGRHM